MGSNNIPPYWHVNVPESQRTASCPDFLLNLSPKDLAIISTPDTDYQVLMWEEVRSIIAKNRLDLFQRIPSDLRRYKAFTYKLSQQYGTVTNFILNQRLRWESPVQPRGRPFEHPDDIKVLYNDWPYGIDKKIVHLVVWTKFSLEEDPSTGDLTGEARCQIDKFVSESFLQHVDPDQVCIHVHDIHHIFYILLSAYFRLTPTAHLVQKLGESQICQRCGTFPCHDVRSGPGIRASYHQRRCATEC